MQNKPVFLGDCAENAENGVSFPPAKSLVASLFGTRAPKVAHSGPRGDPAEPRDAQSYENTSKMGKNASNPVLTIHFGQKRDIDPKTVTNLTKL